jgi:hypothetical protein
VTHGRRTHRLRLRGISQPVRHGSTRPTTRDSGDVEAESLGADDAVVRDAEQSLVAALQESDTAIETMQDAEADGVTALHSNRVRVTLAGLALALLALLVARRRS